MFEGFIEFPGPYGVASLFDLMYVAWLYKSMFESELNCS